VSERVYCLDTSALIDLTRHYPRDVFPRLWDRLGQLADTGRAISHREVREEITRGDDSLVDWAKGHKVLFLESDSAVVQKSQEIIARFPELVDPDKEGPDADPFLIALVLAKQEEQTLFPGTYAVVSQESRKGIKIPHVCEHYGVECLRYLDMFREEQWAF
jgi:hypothetical protein